MGGEWYRRTISFEKNISGTAHILTLFGEAAGSENISVRQQQKAYESYVTGKQGGLLKAFGSVAESRGGQQESSLIAYGAFWVRLKLTGQPDPADSREAFSRKEHLKGEWMWQAAHGKPVVMQLYVPVVTQLSVPSVISVTTPIVLTGTHHHRTHHHRVVTHHYYTHGAPKPIVPPP